jgi:hypothetical protein
MNQIEQRLQNRVDLRAAADERFQALLREVDGGNLSETQQKAADNLRDEIAEYDGEIAVLTRDAEASREAEEQAKAINRALRGSVDGVEADGDGIVYRSMAAYALDVILTRGSTECAKIAAQFGDKSFVEAAAQRLDLLKRTPANTLSSNVGGLIPPEHISQIFQVIDSSRPLVAAAPSTGLVRGTLTYPRVDTRPVVAVQSSEKTEAGNTGMAVSMQTATAVTYLGGGDLSWQAINWSTPDALQLWFNLCAADYALKTETAAGDAVTDSAFGHIISSPLGSTPTFADFMTAVGAGYAKVFNDSGRTANTILMAPDRFGYLLGLTSAAFSQFTNVGASNVGPLSIIVTRGFSAGEIVVGDMAGLLVAETPGAPVELRVVEPAIGGVEVGIIGAFKPVVVDAGSFSLITTAS